MVRSNANVSLPFTVDAALLLLVFTGVCAQANIWMQQKMVIKYVMVVFNNCFLVFIISQCYFFSVENCIAIVFDPFSQIYVDTVFFQ